MDQRFSGSQEYVASDALMMAVNAAITVEKPWVSKGEPGTGNPLLAEQVWLLLWMHRFINGM